MKAYTLNYETLEYTNEVVLLEVWTNWYGRYKDAAKIKFPNGNVCVVHADTISFDCKEAKEKGLYK